MVAHLELLQLPVDVTLQFLYGFSYIGQHICQFAAEPLDFSIDHVIVHLSSGLSVDQVIVNVGLLAEPLHAEGHFLLEEEFGNIGDVRGEVVSAVLFFEETG